MTILINHLVRLMLYQHTLMLVQTTLHPSLKKFQTGLISELTDYHLPEKYFIIIRNFAALHYIGYKNEHEYSEDNRHHKNRGNNIAVNRQKKNGQQWN